jgi:hypothetical protein
MIDDFKIFECARDDATLILKQKDNFDYRLIFCGGKRSQRLFRSVDKCAKVRYTSGGEKFMSKLVIDMMGSDLGQRHEQRSRRSFQRSHPDCTLILVGKKEELADMKDYQSSMPTDVVKMETGALEVLRKKDSSMVKAIKPSRRKADGVVSAGSTGAFLSASTLILKKIPGVIRPALVTSFPNLKAGGFTTALDVGASNANTPEEIAQFALDGLDLCGEGQPRPIPASPSFQWLRRRQRLARRERSL